MSSKILARVERAFVLLLVLSFAVPLVLQGWLWHYHPHSPSTAWLRNATLSGFQEQPVKVELTRHKVLSGKYQSALANNYNITFPGRELLIRIAGEIYLRAFHASPASAIIVGPGLNLDERGYAEEYCFRRADDTVLVPLVDDLRRMQDFCAARGTAFALLITPSKAAVEPASVPQSYLRRYRPGPRCYDRLLLLLQEKGIHYVDGHRLTAEMEGKTELPIFPPGGVHWGDPVTLITCNALLETLASQGLGVAPIHDYKTTVTEDLEGQDNDLALIANTLFPMRYPVSDITVQGQPVHAGHAPTLAIVGGSFIERPLLMLGASRQFSEINFYFYYKALKKSTTDGTIHFLPDSRPPVDFETDIFAADSLLLEVNEETMCSPHHLTVFLHDALAVLPDPHAAKAPFHYESRFEYQWGDILSFRKGKCPADIVNSEGIAPSYYEGAWTDKPVVSMRLATPPASEDMVLAITAQPYLSRRRVPSQVARVVVNDHPVGEMVWTENTVTRQQLTIPRKFLDAEETHLRLEMVTATSPASQKDGPDTRPLGIDMASLQLYGVGDHDQDPGAARVQAATPPPSEPVGLPSYRWGEEISLRTKWPGGPETVKGFAFPEGGGTWTEGPESALSFSVSPAPEDMVLEVDARPFLYGARLSQQSVDVVVNRHPIGRLTWLDDSPRRTLVVPKDFLGGNELQLKFRVQRPTSPAEVGMSGDQRKLGVNIASIRLHPAGK